MLQPPSVEAYFLADALPHLLWTTDVHGRTLWGNPAWHAYVPPDAAGSPVSLLDLAHPEDRPQVEALFRASPLTDPTFALDLQLRGADSRLHWFHLDGTAVDGDGWQITATNIDALKHAQHQMRVLQGVIDASPNCIKILDLDARVLSMNAGGRAVMEIDDFEVCRHLLWPDFWQGEGRAQVEAALDRARAGKPSTFEAAAATFKGTLKWWEVSVSPLYDERGQVHQLSAISRDVTPRKTAQDAVTALDTFVALTEAVGSDHDVPVLIQRAIRAVRASLAHVSAAYYELDGDVWKARAWSDDITPEIVAQIQAGVPREAPNYAQAARTGTPLFVDGWDASREALPSAASYGAVALLPLGEAGQVSGLFTVGTRNARAWTDQERAIVRAVGRSLGLALERTAQTRRLAEKNAELDARNRALSAFEAWTRDLTLDTEPYALIRRAQALLRDLLSLPVTVYYERSGDRWYVRSMLGEYGSDENKRLHDEGLLHAQASNLRIPFETGETYCQPRYDASVDSLAQYMTHVTAAVMLPLKKGGEIRGILGLGVCQWADWSDTDRTIVETVRGSLELALDRAEQVAALHRERATLAARTAALEDANEELEAFAYSVSHDLRTPVRHITSFTDLLRKSFGPALDAKAERYLGVVSEAAGRMNTLIDAMLELSRTSRLPLRLGPVDLGELVRQIRQEFEPDLLGREVRWDVQPLPLVAGDQDTLRQVLANLLSNALKYTRTRSVAVIRVWAERREQETAVFVGDNGVGFDPQYTHKLFGVFQRLHRADEFEGTGVGLANVRRIIARHEGRVWAHSTAGEGATFGFALPASPVTRDR